jgi:hypothetical protein
MGMLEQKSTLLTVLGRCHTLFSIFFFSSFSQELHEKGKGAKVGRRHATAKAKRGRGGEGRGPGVAANGIPP